MLDQDQLVQVRFNSKIASHYRELGYTFNKNDIINVPVKHLTKQSAAKVSVICDLCGAKKTIRYCDYVTQHNDIIGDICKKCIPKAQKILCNYRYGVDHPSQLESVKQKHIDTNQKRYGVSNVFQLEDVKLKSKESCLKKYGVEHASQSEQVRNKMKNTMMERYGAEYALQCDIFQEKRVNTLYKYDKQKTSNQQFQVYCILKQHYDICELNYPLGCLNLDCMIEVDGCRIDVEYDGWYWHKDSQKDYARDVIVKQYGYKILRIKSGMKVPDEHTLINAIECLIKEKRTYKQIVLEDYKHT